MWNFPPRRILCPVDFGETSAAALRVAGVIVKRFGADLTVMHAETFDAPPYFTTEQMPKLEADRLAARRRAQLYLTRFAGLAGVPFQAAVTDGPTSPAILNEAPLHDLVVMGTHGRRGASRWWLGSVAERVVRESPVPVLVVRAAADGAVLFARIAAASDASLRGIAYAEDLAMAFGGLTGATPAEATVLIASRPSGSAGVVAIEGVAAYLRASELPVLFVPEEAAAAA